MSIGEPKSLRTCQRFFLQPRAPKQRQYEALRAYFVEGRPPAEVARDFGYTPGSFHVMCHHFRREPDPTFFASPRPGPRSQPKKSAARDLIVALRKQNHSIYEISEELQRPAGYEETGFVTRDIPGLSVGVFSSSAPGHSLDRWRDSLKEVGHTGFVLDAKIMAAVLYDYLEDADFRTAVKHEHGEMAGLFNQYLEGLTRAYASETGIY